MFNTKDKYACPRCYSEKVSLYVNTATCSDCNYSQTSKRFNDAYKIKVYTEKKVKKE